MPTAQARCRHWHGPNSSDGGPDPGSPHRPDSDSECGLDGWTQLELTPGHKSAGPEGLVEQPPAAAHRSESEGWNAKVRLRQSGCLRSPAAGPGEDSDDPFLEDWAGSESVTVRRWSSPLPLYDE